ncbi:Ras GTPase activating protein ira2 [Borealophlyctis nickersoniae]|nr:Ras GTPase activating protein ira2 [Borealophlyctis nickersoniae]
MNAAYGQSSGDQHRLSFMTSAASQAHLSPPAPMSAFVDPPPLEDALAKFILNIVTRFFLTSAALINTDTINHNFSIFSAPGAGHVEFGSSLPNPSELAHLVSHPSLSIKFNEHVDMTSEIHRAAGRILFYLSASNWGAVFHKIKMRLAYLAQLGNLMGQGNGDLQTADREGGDLTELRFLEWCCLNRTRLSMVIAELSHISKSFGKRAQFLTAIVLRRAIWNWIEVFPVEFLVLCQSGKKLEGNPDTLFDIFGSASESSRRKVLFWPVQTTLLILCPDILLSIVNAPEKLKTLNLALAKKAAFVDGLKKSIRTKLWDVSVVCYIEICKAATWVGRVEGGSLRALVPGIEADLKEKLFDLSKPVQLSTPTTEDSSFLVDQRLLTECLTALYKLNPWTTLRGVVPLVSDVNAPAVYKVVLAKACWAIVNEDQPLPWNPTIDASLGGQLRQLFLDNLNRERLQDQKGKRAVFLSQVEKKRRAQVEEANERLEIVCTILKTWCKCPLLAIAKDATVINPDELRALFNGITNCLLDPSASIRSAAWKTLLRLLEPQFVPCWDGTRPEWAKPYTDDTYHPTESSMKIYWRLSSQVMMSVSRLVLELRADLLDFAGAVSVARDLLNLIKELLIRRNEFLRNRAGGEAALWGSQVPDRFAASVAMEVALLVFVCSADVEISATAARCLGLLVDEAEITGEAGTRYEGPGMEDEDRSFMSSATLRSTGVSESVGTDVSTPTSPTGSAPRDTSLPVVDNIGVYRDLRALFDTGPGGAAPGGALVTGQKAQQKRIRKVLRNIVVPSAGNMGAWEEVYRRWRGLSAAVSTRGYGGPIGGVAAAKLPDENDKPRQAFLEDKGEWANYTGFLCALGGVCLHASSFASSGKDAPPQIPQATLSRRTSTSFGSQDGDVVPQGWNGVVGSQLMNSYSHARATVERFVVELMELMQCDNVVVREAAKEFLGGEMNLGLYGILFTQFEKVVTRFFDTLTGEATCTDRNTLFVENTISVLKLILDRADEVYHSSTTTTSGAAGAGSDTPNPSPPFTLDFPTLILVFVRYLNRLGTLPTQSGVALRIKVRLCQLVEVVVAKKELVGLRQEMKFRNRVLEGIVEWTTEFSSNSSDSLTPEEQIICSSKNQKLHRDLDLACMKAIVSLLSGLPLMVNADGANKAEGTSANATDNKAECSNAAVEAKSRMFMKYLSFFLKVLQKCRLLESMEPGSNATSGSLINSDLASLLGKSKETTQHLSPLKEYTILALSNLLSANIDIGLRYSLPMGYHDDPKTRAAFMQVLTNVLGMGAVEAFAGLGDEHQGVHERYEKFVEFVTGRGMSVAALGLCDVAPVGDVDEIASVLVHVFEGRGRALELLTKVVEREVASTDAPTNLFRRNSMATRLLTVYARQQGQEYLRLTIQPLVDELMERPMSFEINPIHMSPHEDAETNLRNVKMVAQGFLDSILGNVAHVPKPLRDACCIIARVVGAKFQSARMTAVGGFLFLRFFCPAIVSPESHDLVKQPIESTQLRRGLVLTTKVIQNLANNVLFGIKENYMASLNDVLRDNYARVHGFLRDVSTPQPYDPNTDTLRPETRIVDELDIMRLHRHLALNLDKIERWQAPPPTPVPATVATEGGEEPNGTTDNTAPTPTAEPFSAFSELATLLARLGPAPDVSRLEMAMGRMGDGSGSSSGGFGASAAGARGKGAAASRVFVEFMSRVEKKAGAASFVEELKEKECFFEGGVSRGGRPVLYYIARRVLPESMDMELVIYFIMLTMKSVITRPYDFVLDVTQFSAENEWQLGWLQRFEKLVPFDAVHNLHTVIVFNANTALKKYAKRASRIFGGKFSRRTLFMSSLTEFQEHIGASEQRLPKSTVALEREITNVFQPATRVVAYRQHIPVVIRMTPETVQIAATKKQDILGYPTILNDIFHVSEIDEVVLPGRPDDTELVIRYSEKVNASYIGMQPPSAGGGSNTAITSITLSSPRREMIAQAIRSAKARSRLTKPAEPTTATVLADQRHLRPSDVPGTLLNMALLNLGSEDANLRLASYNLCCALSSSFDFDVASRLLGAGGLCIPPNNQTFVVELSRRIAETKPNLTLEFLLEASIGFQKSSKDLKHFCLEYMVPWLPNLASYAKPGGIAAVPFDTQPGVVSGDEQGGKLREIVKLMIDATVKEHEMFPVLQSKCWQYIADVEEIMPIVLDCFIQTAVSQGMGSQQTEVLANTAVTLASKNMCFVAGKVITRSRKAIASTSIHCAPTLVDHPAWNEIAVLLRFVLMLSFNNQLDVQQFLPELFHIVCMLVGIGTSIVRSSVHGIVVNTVQALCTAGKLDQTSLATLQVLLGELSDMKMCLLFGLGGSSMLHHQYGRDGGWTSNTSSSAFSFTTEALQGEIARDMPLANLETIVNSLLDVMTYGAADAELPGTWKSRWMSLIASTAFQYNPAIQPRAFIALGCLARDDVDDDLLYQILVALRGALTLFEDNESHLIVSIVMALCNITGGLPADSRYLRPMFWLAVALIQIGHQPIFHSAVSLLHEVLRTLNGQGCFDADGMVAALMAAREPIDDVASQLDAAVGIHFHNDFAFAASSTLLKGVKYAGTKTVTMNALTALLEVAAQHEGQNGQPAFSSSARVGRDKLGYILPLLPSSERVEDLFWLAGASDPELDYYEEDGLGVGVTSRRTGPESIDGSATIAGTELGGMGTVPNAHKYRRILDRFEMNDSCAAVLSVSLMVTMLEHAEYETEVLFIYGFLAEAAVAMPEVLALVYDSLLPRMTQVLATSQTPQVLEAVQSILKTMVSRPLPSARAASTEGVHRTSSNPRRSVQQPAPIAGGSPVMTGTSYSSSPPQTPVTPIAAVGGMVGSPSLAMTMSAAGANVTTWLAELGFSGLPECGSFQMVGKARKARNAALACDVVDAIIAL